MPTISRVKCPDCRVGTLYWSLIEIVDREIVLDLRGLPQFRDFPGKITRSRLVCPECGAGWDFKWDYTTQVLKDIAGLTHDNRVQ